MGRGLVFWALVSLAGCGSEPQVRPVSPPPKRSERPPALTSVPPPAALVPPPLPVRPSPGSALSASDVETKHLSEKEWTEGMRQTVAQRWKVEPSALRLSQSQTQVAFVQAPVATARAKSRVRAIPGPYTIMVVDNQGHQQARFRPVQAPRMHEPPKDLQFLGDDRLVYEVAVHPPGAAAAKGSAPGRLFVIQPVRGRSRVVRCVGGRFALSASHIAFIGGQPGKQFVAVDGQQVYPRQRTRTGIVSELAWSSNGMALAFLEARPEAGGQTHLVLLADVGNATGDTTWDLPPAAVLDGLHVFWADAQKLVVGKSLARPVFATSFQVERPQ